MVRSHLRRGFTLIELLVVITIIVVLLALLTPALDKAVYQAQLAVCGAKQKGIGSGVTVYAVNHRRSYPHRSWVYGGAWQPRRIWYRLPTGMSGDERKPIRDYVASINDQLHCPLVKELDIDPASNTPGPGESNDAYGSFFLWYGWQYRGQERMSKLGGAFDWKSSDGKTHRSTQLVSDTLFFSVQDNFSGSVHPDQGPAPVMIEDIWDNRSWAPSAFGIVASPATIVTDARWIGRYERGPVDLNSGYQDGSVRRLNGLLYGNDERLADGPYYANEDTKPIWLLLIAPDGR